MGASKASANSQARAREAQQPSLLFVLALPIPPEARRHEGDMVKQASMDTTTGYMKLYDTMVSGHNNNINNKLDV